MLSAALWQVCGIRLPETREAEKMKGLTIIILLAILQIGAISVSNSGSLLTDGPEQAGAMVSEEGRPA